MFMYCKKTEFVVWVIWLLGVLMLGALPATSENQPPLASGSLGNIIEKIVGGKVAKPGSTPWLVSLKDTQYDHPVHFCGGAILTDHWILTAARCIIGYDPPYFDVMVVLGEYDLDEQDLNWEKEKLIIQVIVHPNYDYYTHKYDIALLHVYPSIDFNSRVQPLPLPPSHGNGAPVHPVGNVVEDKFLEKAAEISSKSQLSKDAPTYDSLVKVTKPDVCDFAMGKTSFRPNRETMGYIAGWGRTEENGNLANLVHEAYVPILDNEICRLIYPGFDTNVMMCAGNLTHGGVDPCWGDWGGPMVDTLGYLTGIASWAVGCGRPGFPAVYVDAFVVREWICSVIAD